MLVPLPDEPEFPPLLLEWPDPVVLVLLPFTLQLNDEPREPELVLPETEPEGVEAFDEEW